MVGPVLHSRWGSSLLLAWRRVHRQAASSGRRLDIPAADASIAPATPVGSDRSRPLARSAGPRPTRPGGDTPRWTGRAGPATLTDRCGTRTLPAMPRRDFRQTYTRGKPRPND